MKLTRPRSAREIAQDIAELLFTNGFGEEAERLVLWKDSTDQDLGGLAKVVVIDRITRLLQRHLVT